jgi:hypothetical protein
VLVATRSEAQHCRIILDLEWVAEPGGEAKVAIECFGRLRPLVPGAHGIVYDAALRGVHHQRLLRDLGLLPVNRVVAAEKGARQPRRAEGRRVEKSAHIEDKQIRGQDGKLRTLRLYARAGAVGLGELTDTGELRFLQLQRIRTHRIGDKGGRFRWYNDYAVPPDRGGGTVTVRLHGNAEDVSRKFNRTENVRPIPPSDSDFDRLYARRNDSESINRALDDSMFLGRAHSLGHLRQQVNLLGYALMVNSLALAKARGGPEPRAVPAA